MSKARQSAYRYFQEALQKFDADHDKRRRDTALVALKLAGVPVTTAQEVMGQLGFPYQSADALRKAIDEAVIRLGGAGHVTK
jgi:hypothetical protein